MDKKEIQEILVRAKEFFRTEFAPNHIRNTQKLTKLSAFNPNPFLWEYLATFLSGNTDSESMAKALIYPRALGTSVTTTFGNVMQKFCSKVLEGYGSSTSGIDIEFIDNVDQRRKYCQLKSGPDSLNKDDIDTVKGNFQRIRNLAIRNNMPINLNDLVVGVMYGEEQDLNSFLRVLQQSYNVYVGREFWARLTGDHTFYFKLIKIFSEVAREVEGTSILESVIVELAKDIDNNLKNE